MNPLAPVKPTNVLPDISNTWDSSGVVKPGTPTGTSTIGGNSVSVVEPNNSTKQQKKNWWALPNWSAWLTNIPNFFSFSRMQERGSKSDNTLRNTGIQDVTKKSGNPENLILERILAKPDTGLKLISDFLVNIPDLKKQREKYEKKLNTKITTLKDTYASRVDLQEKIEILGRVNHSLKTLEEEHDKKKKNTGKTDQEKKNEEQEYQEKYAELNKLIDDAPIELLELAQLTRQIEVMRYADKYRNSFLDEELRLQNLSLDKKEPYLENVSKRLSVLKRNLEKMNNIAVKVSDLYSVLGIVYQKSQLADQEDKKEIKTLWENRATNIKTVIKEYILYTQQIKEGELPKARTTIARGRATLISGLNDFYNNASKPPGTPYLIEREQYVVGKSALVNVKRFYEHAGITKSPEAKMAWELAAQCELEKATIYEVPEIFARFIKASIVAQDAAELYNYQSVAQLKIPPDTSKALKLAAECKFKQASQLVTGYNAEDDKTLSDAYTIAREAEVLYSRVAKKRFVRPPLGISDNERKALKLAADCKFKRASQLVTDYNSEDDQIFDVASQIAEKAAELYRDRASISLGVSRTSDNQRKALKLAADCKFKRASQLVTDYNSEDDHIFDVASKIAKKAAEYYRKAQLRQSHEEKSELNKKAKMYFKNAQRLLSKIKKRSLLSKIRSYLKS